MGQRRSSDESETETRGQLVAAAQRLLASQGSAALTSRAIANEAGANLGAITYYFGSKQDLVTASMIATARDLMAPVLEELGSSGDPSSNMLEAVRLLTTIARDHRDELGAYVGVLAAAPGNPAVAAAVRALHREVARRLAEQIDAQRRAASLPAWVDAGAMAQLIVALVHGTLVTSVVDPDHVDEAAIGAQFAMLLLSARSEPTTQG